MGNLNNENEATSLMNRRHSPNQRPDWVIEINESIEKSGKPCTTISQVPPVMRMNTNDEDKYNHVPYQMSIGPFHRNNPSLQAMEAQKLRLLGYFLGRYEQENEPEKSLYDKLEEAMKEVEQEARECYAVSFDTLISSDEFVRMMIVDGCSILEILRVHDFCQEANLPNPIFTTRSMVYTIYADLLMLENQLPFFVLQRLFDMTIGVFWIHHPSLNYLAFQFFNSHQDPPFAIVPVEEHEHLLALIHFCLVPNQQPPSSNLYGPGLSLAETTNMWFGTTTELLCAGIKFKKRPDSIQDIKFANRTLEIPFLFLDEGSTPLLRNMVAYEQCNVSAKPYFTSLVLLYNTLVVSPKDVEHLRRVGIIETPGSNEATVDTLKKLAYGVVLETNDVYFPRAIQRINDHCKRQWRVSRGALRLYYFINQDSISLMLFILALIQTISSLYQIIFESLKSNNS